jgi:cysteine-rich repeat protein
MRDRPFRKPSIGSLFLGLSLFLVSPATAAPLSKIQQGCVNTMNKSGQKVLATQGKENTGCIKAAGSGKLIGTADACLTGDAKGKVQKAETKTSDGQSKKCAAPLPPYGYTSATAVNAAAKAESLNLVADLFTSPLDAAILTDKTGAGCQSAVSKVYERYAATYFKEYNACKKVRLKDSLIVGEAGMEACIGQDPKGKVTKAGVKMLDGINKKCVGVDLAAAFPGECSPQGGSAGTFSACLEEAAICRVCLAINDMDAISRGCDDLDDGLLNASCRQCGNSVTELPEECDDGGESATCDFDCTTAFCGDGTVNATAGESCDDANASDTDPCPTTCVIATCGDGFTCSSTGCTTGPDGGVEQCDDAGANSDVTPDACRTDCAAAHCGDGVVDTGEVCDDSGESATCDDDCTLPQCGDGNANQAAGEECDDGNLDDNDACRNSCNLATCGDGVVCNVVGCTTGPGGGLEECDDAGANSNVTPDACRTNCANPHCGDGVIDAGEQCDDGGESMACDTNCTFAFCGDGTVNSSAGEQCDDGGESATCDADCTPRACGDGTVNATAGEECDDGNTVSGDGCSSTCKCGLGSGEIGCQEALCPNKGELVLWASVTSVACANNGDCEVGTCDTGLGVCRTVSELDTGWTGIAHDADINDQVVTMGRLLCPGPYVGGPEPCGQCQVVGLLADTGDCRCANNNRNVCDQPFQNDADDCGGAMCNCYFGAPLPLSSGNTPACVVNRFAVDVNGTANVDTGAGLINASLRSVVYLGINVVAPCPACGGTCTAPGSKLGEPCATDVNCESAQNAGDGVCGNFDPTPKDGNRQGTCWSGNNNGQSCDIGAYNTSFPAPAGGGAGLSLDCFPSNGLNVSGTGLSIKLAQTTGTSALPPANVDCGFNSFPEECPCGVCTLDTGVTCTSNSDCTGVGTCAKVGNGKPRQNQCSNSICTDVGGGEGECQADPLLRFCDGVSRGDGSGFVACNSNADCAILGNFVGVCELESVKKCFIDPITATGVQDPSFPVGVASFCIPPTGNPGINDVAGLPGPGRVTNAASATTFCASNPAVTYTPGVGGCP